MIFAYPELRRFYRALLERGQTELFRNWQGEKVFLVRHDVDFDLKPASDLAILAAEEGICSTFFILTTCRTYNVLHADSRALLKEISGLGHEIALHFDPTLYGESDLNKAAEKEAEILSFALGEDVKSVSLHNPSVHGQYPLFDNFQQVRLSKSLQ